VGAGDLVVVLEAMKCEQPITAQHGGTLSGTNPADRREHHMPTTQWVGADRSSRSESGLRVVVSVDRRVGPSILVRHAIADTIDVHDLETPGGRLVCAAGTAGS
jgi:hypothetical protein